MSISNQEWSIEKILKKLCFYFIEDLTVLENNGFESFHSFYEHHLAFKGESITIQDGSRHLNGTCEGISESGNLILTSSSQERIEVFAGLMISP